MIPSTQFYGSYYGHPVDALDTLEVHLRGEEGAARSVIYLCGDSSLDNKYWFRDQARATNGYETILKPPTSNRDIAHCMNAELVERSLGHRYAVINCAVEESKVSSRDCGSLLPQDQFIRDHIRSDDILVVSVGGNDIALALSPCTIASMLSVICCTTASCIEACGCGCAVPCSGDLCPCGGACIGCVSNACAFPPGLGYFIHLFEVRIRSYIMNMISRRKPKVVAVCMIYYPCEATGGSWADGVLGVLGYNSNPAKLQALIRKIFKLATSRIRIPGVRVVGVPLYEVLDGKCKGDYEQRVEPSASGGVKMGKFILDHVLEEPSSSTTPIHIGADVR